MTRQINEIFNKHHLGLLAIGFVILLYITDRDLRTGLEETELYDDDKF